jgi:CubicO group peptidase (beta-lactamase class C family)
MTPPPAMALERLVDSLVESGAASSAVALVGDAREVVWCRTAGWARGGPPAGRLAEPSTWFDYGSLTKPFAATLGLVLDRSGELPLATPLGAVLAGAHARLAAAPLANLLRHGARMQAWTPLYARCRSLAAVRELLLGGELLGGRAGTYSDLDYMLWGIAVERALGRPLAALIAERVTVPLGLSSAPAVSADDDAVGDIGDLGEVGHLSSGSSDCSGFSGYSGLAGCSGLAGEAALGAVAAVAAPPGDVPAVAESRMGGGREAELAARQGIAIAPLPPPAPGEPQDGNARFLLRLAARGAIAGHAGLFGTAAALWRLGAEWLAPEVLLDSATVAGALAGGGPFALGWWRRRHRGSGGSGLSPLAFGHSGFAGGSLWIDPQMRRVFVLLAHRLDPACNLNRWRRRFHAAAGRALTRMEAER